MGQVFAQPPEPFGFVDLGKRFPRNDIGFEGFVAAAGENRKDGRIRHGGMGEKGLLDFGR